MAEIIIQGKSFHFNPYEEQVDRHFSDLNEKVYNLVLKKEINTLWAEFKRIAKDRYDNRVPKNKVHTLKSNLTKDINKQFESKGIEQLDEFAGRTNSNDITINWEDLKKSVERVYSEPAKPKDEIKDIPEEPSLKDFRKNSSLWDYIVPSRKKNKDAEAKKQYKKAHERWEERSKKIKRENRKRLKKWEKKKEKISNKREEILGKLDEYESMYEKANEDVVEDVVYTKLKSSSYPSDLCFDKINKLFSGEVEVEYDKNDDTLVVNYDIPEQEKIPRRKAIRYVKKEETFGAVNIDTGRFREIYEKIPYNLSLRVIRHVFLFDYASTIENIVFNGFVSVKNKSTGIRDTVCKASLQCSIDKFHEINIANAEPQSAFRYLDGISAQSMLDSSSVSPIMQIESNTSQFVTSQDASPELADSKNLATIDWEEFEHLLGDLLESVFAEEGGEVKVTQASQDGGIDVIAHDPDPLRGGKILIQAKRYSQTVGVSAVRDLYGTVTSERASRGVIVTTSDFSSSAYDFAKDKPIQLLNGEDLLTLLNENGFEARIDFE